MYFRILVLHVFQTKTANRLYLFPVLCILFKYLQSTLIFKSQKVKKKFFTKFDTSIPFWKESTMIKIGEKYFLSSLVMPQILHILQWHHQELDALCFLKFWYIFLSWIGNGFILSLSTAAMAWIYYFPWYWKNEEWSQFNCSKFYGLFGYACQISNLF